MAPSRSILPLNDQAREEAADWLVAFCEGEVDASGRERFMTWLRASPEHLRAYLRLSALWEDDDLFSRSRKLDADTLVRRALDAGNVVALDRADSAGPDEPAISGSREPRRGLRVLRPHLAIAASMLLAVSGVLTAWWLVNAGSGYETAVGEQRTITLSDGSTITLNARSRVAVKYGETSRSVELIEGQALFRVAKDTARPFVVRSGSTSIRAVGTQFDVYRRTEKTVVTVLEGRVAVSRPASPDDSELAAPSAKPHVASSPIAAQPLTNAFVSAGEQLVATPQVIAAPKQADVAAATAWLEGKLVFNSAPLSDVLDEFNRHTPRRLVLDDQSLGDVPISGIFAFTDASRFVEFLRQRFALVVHETDDEIRIARR